MQTRVIMCWLTSNFLYSLFWISRTSDHLKKSSVQHRHILMKYFLLRKKSPVYQPGNQHPALYFYQTAAYPSGHNWWRPHHSNHRTGYAHGYDDSSSSLSGCPSISTRSSQPRNKKNSSSHPSISLGKSRHAPQATTATGLSDVSSGKTRLRPQ